MATPRPSYGYGSHPIPKILRSVRYNGPFAQTTLSELPLLDPPRPYYAEVYVEDGQPLYEWAATPEEAKDVFLAYSEVSRARIIARFEQKVVERTLAWCCFSGRPRRELSSWVAVADFEGNRMIVSEASPFPLLICGDHYREMVASLSKESQRHLDRFLKQVSDPHEAGKTGRDHPVIVPPIGA